MCQMVTLEWVPGPPDLSGYISALPRLLLDAVLWGRKKCPETPIVLGPQTALPSGGWMGGKPSSPIGPYSEL